jgi:hypothetical protein
MYGFRGHADEQGYVGLDHGRLPPGAKCEVEGSCIVHAGLIEDRSRVHARRRELTHELL